MAIPNRQFPILFNEKGELDAPEVDYAIRNILLAQYALQEDVAFQGDKLGGAIERGEIAEDDSQDAQIIVTQSVIQAVAPAVAGMAIMLNPQPAKIPFTNGALQLDTGADAMTYDRVTHSLGIAGLLTVGDTLAVAGTVDVTGLTTLEGGAIIDVDLAQAFLVRQDGDVGDVFAVDTVTPGVAVTGIFGVSGISTLTGAVNALSTLDVTLATTLLSTLDVTGVVTLTVPLAVPQGGTGAVSFTDGGIMLGSGAGILTVLGQATNGQLPIGSTGVDPVLASITGTANEITVTDGAGSITLSVPSTFILSGSLEVTTTSLLTGAQTFVGAGEFQTSFEISNTAEGNTGSRNWLTAHETHTLSLAATSVTTTLAIPAGARLIGASFNVDTAVTDDAGDDTWSAAFSGGASGILATAAAPAQDTKVDTLTIAEITTATTEITFTPNGGNFTAGVIEVVVYYETLTSLANV